MGKVTLMDLRKKDCANDILFILFQDCWKLNTFRKKKLPRSYTFAPSSLLWHCLQIFLRGWNLLWSPLIFIVTLNYVWSSISNHKAVPSINIQFWKYLLCVRLFILRDEIRFASVTIFVSNLTWISTLCCRVFPQQLLSISQGARCRSPTSSCKWRLTFVTIKMQLMRTILFHAFCNNCYFLTQMRNILDANLWPLHLYVVDLLD